ncbi:MAG: glycosyltransferase family 2 protein [Clostridia bacterium]|nr:glycosyltransferase family 2 protein [Clostridia bacterium]
MKKDILYVVIPCYNEEEVINETTKRLKEKLNTLIKSNVISPKSRVMYVNDGSKDKTWSLIKKIDRKEKLFTGITLSRNRGHQNALVAGLLTAKEYSDVVISMDADLQDDINAIDEMLKKYHNGCDVVYGVRSSRKKDTFFKKITAQGFYKFMAKMGVNVIYNHADYRLTSKRVLNEFEKYKEVNLFLRGIFPLIGFKTDVVYYERAERFAGSSKYPLKKMLNFAWDGITSFSVKPIRAVLSLGIVIFLISLLVMIYCLIVKIAGYTVEGWTFLAVSIWLVAGVQMLSLGIIGEYVGKVYNETKARPRYIISENLNEKRLGKRLKKRTEKRLVKSLIKNINTSEITNSI